MKLNFNLLHVYICIYIGLYIQIISFRFIGEYDCHKIYMLIEKWFTLNRQNISRYNY